MPSSLVTVICTSVPLGSMVFKPEPLPFKRVALFHFVTGTAAPLIKIVQGLWKLLPLSVRTNGEPPALA